MLSWSPVPSSSSSSVDCSRCSPRSSKVHAASLVDPLTHPEELLQLVDIELSRPVIEYVVDYISDVVDEALERGGVVILHRTPSYLSDFTTFVSQVLYRAQVTPATLLVALSYLDRASDKLCISLEEWALERVFLGALICAAKYANDSSLRNIHWAICTGIFGKRDIGRIEAEFLDVMQWRMGVSEAGIMAHREGLLAAIGVRLSVVARPLPLPPRPQHRHTSSTSSTTSSVPSLSPPSPRSPSPSPTLSPPTPPLPAHLPHVPIDATALADLEASVEYTAKHAVRTRCTLLRSLPIPMIALPCRTRARARPQFV
ncbi:hypothetical protein FB45DRAFT_936094, partial [Roridomyces roridus]